MRAERSEERPSDRHAGNRAAKALRRNAQPDRSAVQPPGHPTAGHRLRGQSLRHRIPEVQAALPLPGAGPARAANVAAPTFTRLQLIVATLRITGVGGVSQLVVNSMSRRAGDIIRVMEQGSPVFVRLTRFEPGLATFLLMGKMLRYGAEHRDQRLEVERLALKPLDRIARLLDQANALRATRPTFIFPLCGGRRRRIAPPTLTAKVHLCSPAVSSAYFSLWPPSRPG